jgi:hypothetical protein
MRIVFVLGSYCAGKDGVGDYVCRLAQELNILGHQAHVLALNDGFTDVSEEYLHEDSGLTHVLRLPAALPWKDRVMRACRFVQKHDPDVLSLQYVPFAFHPKGLSRRLPQDLRAISRDKPWHLMCHELWIDKSFPLPLKHRVLGFIQKPLVSRLIRLLRPRSVHTQIEHYRDMLRCISVDSELMPLHGNIPRTALKDDSRSWLCNRIGAVNGEVLAGFFGELLPTIDLEKVSLLVAEHAKEQKRLRVVIAGRLSQRGESIWSSVKSRLGNHVRADHLGPLSVPDVSRYLCALDLGLTTYPIELSGKSGAVAAMLEHGLAVWPLGRMRFSAVGASSKLIVPANGFSVRRTAETMLASLSAN